MAVVAIFNQIWANKANFHNFMIKIDTFLCWVSVQLAEPWVGILSHRSVLNVMITIITMCVCSIKRYHYQCSYGSHVNNELLSESYQKSKKKHTVIKSVRVFQIMECSWGPGSQMQFLALKLVPRSLTGTFFETHCRLYFVEESILVLRIHPIFSSFQ
jgi:hypothetical protein